MRITRRWACSFTTIRKRNLGGRELKGLQLYDIAPTVLSGVWDGCAGGDDWQNDSL